MNALEEFEKLILDAGIILTSNVTVDNQWHRCRVEDGKGSPGRYIVKEPVKGFFAGTFGRWDRQDFGWENWTSKGFKQLPPEQQAQFRKERREANLRAWSELEKKYKKGAMAASFFWDLAEPLNGKGHAYLKRKGVRDHGLRVDDRGRLLIPGHNISGELATIQYIEPHKDWKEFEKDAKKGGSSFEIDGTAGSIYFAEGYATAATCHEATGFKAVVCFDAGNLQKVIPAYKKKYPRAEFIIAADNDAFKPAAGNTGIRKALEAAKKVNAKIAIPFFKNTSSKPTDFNDLYKLEGLDAVRRQLDMADFPIDGKIISLPPSTTAYEISNAEYPEPKHIIDGLLPEGLTVLSGKPKFGKSVMALNIALGLATGGQVLGLDVKKMDVVYITFEDPCRRLKVRQAAMLADTRVSGPKNLIIYNEWYKMGQGGLRQLQKAVKWHDKAKLYIIDTWRWFAPVGGGKRQNAYERDYMHGGQLKKFSDMAGISILLIHHTTKYDNSDDVFDLISGSYGLPAAADTLMVVKNSDTLADGEMHIVGREIPQVSYAIKYERALYSWTITGDLESFGKTAAEQAIMDFLKEHGTSAGPKYIIENTGLSPSVAKKTLKKLHKAGKINRTTRGQYAYPLHDK